VGRGGCSSRRRGRGRRWGGVRQEEGRAEASPDTQGESTQGCFLEVSLRFLSKLRNHPSLSGPPSTGDAQAVAGAGAGPISGSEPEALSQDSQGEPFSAEAALKECVNSASGQSLFCLYGLHLPIPDHGTPAAHPDSPLVHQAPEVPAGSGKLVKGGPGLRLGTREKAAQLFEYILPYAASCSVSAPCLSSSSTPQTSLNLKAKMGVLL